VRDRGGVPCQRVLHLTEQKLRSLAQQIQQLRRTQHYMRQLVRQWRKQLAQAPPGSKAMLLHSLADKPRSEFKVDPFRRTTKTMKNLSMMATVLLCMFVASLQAQDTKEGAMNTCPMHQQHASANSHHAAVEKNGDQAMGFPHDKTTHHFRLAANGGVIEVTVDDPSDASNTEAIRSHLSHIAILFGNGDFTTPMFVHDGVPPGVTIMQLVKGAIRYRYEEVPSGGRVRVESGDPVAIAAIHDFIRFQITEHQTGDDLGVTAAH
jgi:TusA-related sulfurtransferase